MQSKTLEDQESLYRNRCFRESNIKISRISSKMSFLEKKFIDHENRQK